MPVLIIMERFYSASEVARILGLARETVYRKVKTGEIPALRVGGSLRFPASQLQNWLDRKTNLPVDRWRNSLRRFVDLLCNEWGEDLVSVVLFGSFAAKKETKESDIDCLIIKKNLSDSRLERQEVLFDLAKKISPAFAHKLSPVILTPDEASEPKPIFLGILEAYEVLLDKKDFFKGLLEEFKKSLNRLGAQKMDEGGLSYWVFPFNGVVA